MSDARSFGGRVELARQLWAEGRYREAAREYRGALAMSPAHAPAEVWEECITLESTLDPAADHRSELRRLISRHPLRERLVELLMRAHQRAGERIEALDTFHRLQARLLINTGRRPNAALCRLYEDIEHETIPAPDQLPADIEHFTGRAELLWDLGMPTGVTVITGQAGVGKTALAVHWAKRLASSFQDGRLYLNLRGYDHGEPVTAAEALKIFLHALGVPPKLVPDAVGERRLLLQSLMAKRRLLIVLDNAADADHVMPLLTAPSGSAVVVTSRNTFDALPDAGHIHLGLLEIDESHELLRRVLGADRVDAEPEATNALAWACGHLPLALRIVAGELAATPERRIANAVAELAGDGDGVDQTTAALDLAYRKLPPAARTLLRRIGCTPAADITLDGASALLGTPADEPLATLTAAHLVTKYRPGRYRMHDLVRYYAVGRSAKDSASHRDAAMSRWLDHLIAAVDAAGVALSPTFNRLPRPRAAQAPTFPDGRQAAYWLAHEHQNLMAAVAWASEHGFDIACAHLVDALRSCFWQTQDLTDWVRAGEFGLASAARDGDPRLLASMHCNLGTASVALGKLTKAVEHNTQALALFERLDDWSGTVTMLINLCMTHERSSTEHVPLLERAFDIGVEHGCVDTQFLALAGLINSQLRLGTPQRAVETATQSLRLSSTRDPRQRPTSLEHLGRAYLELGELERAQQSLHEALELQSAAGNRSGGLFCLTAIGQLSIRAGDTDHAVAILQLVLDEAEELGNPFHIANALSGIGEAQARTDSVEALAMADRALQINRDLPDLGGQSEALIILSDIHLALGNPTTAGDCAEEALALAEQHDIGRDTGRALHAVAAARLAQGDYRAARTALSAALDRHRATRQGMYEVEDLMLLAELHRRTGDDRVASEHESAASAICGQLAGAFAPKALRAAWLRCR